MLNARLVRDTSRRHFYPTPTCILRPQRLEKRLEAMLASTSSTRGLEASEEEYAHAYMRRFFAAGTFGRM